MRVVIGNDHAGVDLKFKIIELLKSLNFDVDNVGTDSLESIDYPDYAEKACKKFLSGKYEFGILICGTGIGISIAANKIKGIRAALLNDCYSAKMAKRHNNANFICFGAKIEHSDSIENMIKDFINEKYEGGRHQTRLDKLENLK